jgi:hypothetical protein
MTASARERLFDPLIEAAKASGFDPVVRHEDDSVVFSAWGHIFPIAFHVAIDKARNHIAAWFSVRTTSWNWDGERTDLHDAIGHTLALTCSMAGHSCSCWRWSGTRLLSHSKPHSLAPTSRSETVHYNQAMTVPPSNVEAWAVPL